MLCEKDNLCILITEYVIREGAPTGPLKVIRESHWKNSPDIVSMFGYLFQAN